MTDTPLILTGKAQAQLDALRADADAPQVKHLPDSRRIAVADHARMMAAITEAPDPSAPLGKPRTRRLARTQAASAARHIVSERKRIRALRMRSQIADLPADLAARSYTREDLADAATGLPDDAPLADVLAEAARLADAREPVPMLAQGSPTDPDNHDWITEGATP